MSQEQDYYSPILEDTVHGVEKFAVGGFRPCAGTVLVVLAPEVAKVGNIQLPDRVQERPNVGRVAAVPLDDPNCPVDPGDWVTFVPNSGRPIPLDGRKDLMLFSYTDDAGSEILGVLSEPLL